METIGAHFSAFIENRKNLEPGNYGYESARSCLYSLLKSSSTKRVHVPNYICEAVPDVIRDAGVTPVRFAIDRKFRIDGELDIQPGDLILIVDYFGLSEDAVRTQLSKLSQSSVVVDCSQAYFQKPFDCLANIYSGRKFIPVADGGFIRTDCLLKTEEADEKTSIERYEYLIKRVNTEPELSRDLYLWAEQSLSKASLRSISGLSKKIIETTNLDFIMERRRDNFYDLGRLSKINKLTFQLGDQVPLCYPLMVKNGTTLREKLRKKRILTPKYWPDINPLNDFEQALLEDVVYLPVDHRYGRAHMHHIVDIVMDIS